jgi:uncharacterized protein (TIGR02611 family)
MLRHTARAGRLVAGVVLVLVGLVLAFPGVPGPGLLIVFGGLGLLSHEFEWARRLRDWMHGTATRIARRTTNGG